MPHASPDAALVPTGLTAVALACERDERLLFKDLSFELPPGQLLQIEGENGAGKTSLLRILCGLAEPASGEVHWQACSIAEQRAEFHQALLYLGHQSGVKLDLSPRENLAFYGGMSAPTSNSELEAALDAVGLYGYEDQPARTLSAGQRRRVALARLPLSPAPLWVLDEPFTALDKAGIAWLEAVFARHLDAGGLIVLTTHQTLNLERPVRRLALS